MKSKTDLLLVFVAVVCFCLPGCGGNQFPVAPAKGKVVAGGKPVTSGSITFVPMGSVDSLEAGKPASAAIGADGTFVLSTFNRFDGAILGKHKVQYNGTEDEDSEEDEPASEGEEGSAEPKTVPRPATAQAKPQYVLKGETIVEVTAGGPNDFTIELSPAGR